MTPPKQPQKSKETSSEHRPTEKVRLREDEGFKTQVIDERSKSERKNASTKSSSSKDVEVAFNAQRIWFDLVRRANWRSIAIVPANPTVDVQSLAFDFARLASLQPESRVLLVDGGASDPHIPLPKNVQRTKTSSLGDRELLEEFLPTLEGELAAGHSGTSHVIIAATFLWEKASTIPLVRAADAWVLGITLGETSFAGAKETLDLLERDRLLGSVLVPSVNDVSVTSRLRKR